MPEPPPAEAGENVIVGEDYVFRSKIRHLSAGDIPQFKPDDAFDDDAFDDDDEEEEAPQIDEFKFADAFMKRQDVYIPAWRGRYGNAGHTVTLSVVDIFPEDIERMDFIAVT